VAENTKFRIGVQASLDKMKWLLYAAIIGGFGNLIFSIVKMAIGK